jgi:hypothetical protein
MAGFIKELPMWNAAGVKPPQSKLDNGWAVAEKPPADWFNWQQFTIYKALQELQQGTIHKDGSVNFAAAPTVPTATAGDNSQKLANTTYIDSMAYNTPTATAANLVNGLQVLTVPKGSPYNVLNIVGRTLVNLLGRDGNCEDVSKWSTGATVTLDATNKVFGSNGFKMVMVNTIDSIQKVIPHTVGNKYLILGSVKNGTATDIGVGISGIANGVAITGTAAFSTAYMTYTATATSHTAQVRATGSAGKIAYMDGIAVYEITAAEKTYIDGLSTANAQAYITAKYAYCDDVKHVNAPYVLKYGENLLPTFNEFISLFSTYPKTITDPYKYTVNKTGTADWVHEYVEIPTIAGQQHTYTYDITISGLTGNGAYALLQYYDNNGVQVGNNPVNYVTASGTYTGSYTAPANTSRLRFGFVVHNGTTGTFSYSNPRLNLGAVDKGIKPRNDDMLAFPNVQLASSVDGTVYDTLFKRDGKYWRENRFQKDMVLDGILAWVFNADGTGFKTVQVDISGMVQDTNVITKFDGKILQRLNFGSSATNGDQSVNSATRIYVVIADTDSGWGETYTPSAAEIQAYFYGWRMHQNTSTVNPYTSGTKYWAKINALDSTGNPRAGAVNGTDYNNTTLPTSYGIGWIYTPYKLTYQLATPTFEEIQVDAGMSLHEGLNQIEVGQAGVIREKVTPVVRASDSRVAINLLDSLAHNFPKGSQLRNRINKSIAVYKNGKVDNTWTTSPDAWANGNFLILNWAYNFDQTATYEVTYLALDQYLLSAPVQAVTGETASNLKTVVDTLATNQADQDARISANELLARQIYNVPQKTTAAMTLYVDATNGADNNDGSAGKPFKTIMRAINSIPQVVNHVVNINVAAGTYAEDIIMYGFMGGGNGVINLVASSTSVIANKIDISQCSIGSLTVSNFTFTKTGDYVIQIRRSTGVVASGCVVTTADATYAAIRTAYSTAYVSSCTLSNRAQGILSDISSLVFSNNNSGTGNTVGIYAGSGGILTTSGPQPTGTTNSSVANGGVITSGVLNPWGDNTQANRSRVFYAVNATQSINAATNTKVLFQSAGTDNLSEFATSKFTAKSAGTYDLKGLIGFNSGMSASVLCTITAYKNGSANKNLRSDNGSSYATPMIPFSGTIDLAAGDYLEIYINTSGATVLSASTSYIDITRIA